MHQDHTNVVRLNAPVETSRGVEKVCDLRNRFDSREPTTGHDKRKHRPAGFRGWLQVRLLEKVNDVIPERHGVAQGFHRQGMLGDTRQARNGSPKVHVGHFASLTLGGGSSMLVSQSMIPPMSADAEWRQSLRIRPPAFRL